MQMKNHILYNNFHDNLSDYPNALKDPLASTLLPGRCQELCSKREARTKPLTQGRRCWDLEKVHGSSFFCQIIFFLKSGITIML